MVWTQVKYFTKRMTPYSRSTEMSPMDPSIKLHSTILERKLNAYIRWGHTA